MTCVRISRTSSTHWWITWTSFKIFLRGRGRRNIVTFYAQLLFKTATISVLILKRSWKMNDIDTLKTSGWGGAANAFCNGRVKWRNFQLVLWNIILEWDLVADGMSLACVIYSTAAPTNEVTKLWPNNGTHHLDELAWKTSRQHHPRHRIILIPCHLFHFIVIWFFFLSFSLFVTALVDW